MVMSAANLDGFQNRSATILPVRGQGRLACLSLNLTCVDGNGTHCRRLPQGSEAILATTPTFRASHRPTLKAQMQISERPVDTLPVLHNHS
jgi:hypothetical protein